jgi:alpha-tubulin suppressor-like RCC1 family protein
MAVTGALLAGGGSAQAFSGAGGLSAGDGHTCAIVDTTNSISCWGRDDFGQTSQADAAPGTFRAISAGGSRTCAITAASSLQTSCWGQPGQGPGWAAHAIDVGMHHTCLLEGADYLACGGRNEYGQSSSASAATGPFKAVSVGDWQSCAIDASDSISCWGRDDFGQTSGPDGASGPFKALAAAHLHTCAIDATDSIRCWGDDSSGQTSGPDAAAGTFAAISAGGDHTCALDTAGGIRCWGDDSHGETSGPNAAAGTFTAIGAGRTHTCALDSSRSISCWGDDSYGQVSGPDGASGGFGGGVLDTTPPETSLDSGPTGITGPGKTNDSTPTFTFSADEPATFQCRVDGGSVVPCSSPFTTSHLADGPHTFSVAAVDSAGNTDASPQATSFTVAPTCGLLALNLKPLGIPINLCLPEARS